MDQLNTIMKSAELDTPTPVAAPSADSEKYFCVAAITKELQDVNTKSDAIVQKIRAQTDETAKLKETLMILTGAKLAFQKIVDASGKADGMEEKTNTAA